MLKLEDDKTFSCGCYRINGSELGIMKPGQARGQQVKLNGFLFSKHSSDPVNWEKKIRIAGG